MRMAFGLVSVLVTLGIIILAFSMFLDSTNGPSVIGMGIIARDEAKQIAGIGMDGEAATNSAAFREVTSNSGKLDSLLVTQVVRGGAYDTHFGLKRDDSITHINGMKVNDIANGDGALAKAMVSDAYARQWPITVVRDGQTIELPQKGVPPAAPAPAVAGGAAPAPAAPAAVQEDARNSYRKQLEAIKGAVN